MRDGSRDNRQSGLPEKLSQFIANCAMAGARASGEQKFVGGAAAGKHHPVWSSPSRVISARPDVEAAQHTIRFKVTRPTSKRWPRAAGVATLDAA